MVVDIVSQLQYKSAVQFLLVSVTQTSSTSLQIFDTVTSDPQNNVRDSEAPMEVDPPPPPPPPAVEEEVGMEVDLQDEKKIAGSGMPGGTGGLTRSAWQHEHATIKIQIVVENHYGSNP